MRGLRVLAGATGIALGALLGAMLLSGERPETMAPGEPVPIAASDEVDPSLPEVPEPRVGVSGRTAIDDLPAAGEEEDPTGTLLARVVDPWDRPVAGVWVRVVRVDGKGRSVVGSWRGRDAVEVQLPVGVAHRIEARGDDLLFEPVSVEPVFAEDGEVRVRLPAKGGRISGRILAAEGREPLDGAGLVAMVPREGETHSLTRNSLPGGVFDFLMTAGEVELHASAPEREARVAALLVRPGDWIRDVEIALPLAESFSLAGRVLDDGGAPVAGARVVLASLTATQRGGNTVEILDDAAEATTDAAGRFRIDGLSSAEQVAEVRARGCEPTGRFSLALIGGENDVEVVLLRGGRLRLRALLPAGSAAERTEATLRRDGADLLRASFGGPAVGHVFRDRRHFRVYGVPSRESPFPSKSFEWMSPRDGEGYETIEGVAPGRYELLLEAGAFEGRSEVFVVAGETATVDVPLSAKR
jgi:hypothetical protein